MRRNNLKKGYSKKSGTQNIRTEDVVLTYVRPINKHGTLDILQCYICTKNGYTKVGIDVWRDLDYHDTPSHPVKTFPSLAELEKQYDVLYQLKCESDVKTTKIIYGKRRYAYGLSS